MAQREYHRRGQSNTMRGLMGIRGDVVVVADPDVLRKPEQSQQNETDGSRGKRISEPADGLIEDDGDACQDGEIDKDQDREGRAEEFEPERIEILGERTMQDYNILVQKFAAGELPRNI